jgi:hypothetical protein
MAPNLSRLGQQDGSGAEDANFLKQWSGEILTAFEEKNVMKALHTVRQVQSMKSAQFPATWKASASYHTPGTELTGQTINHNEVEVFLDYPLIADVFVSQWDELVNHYDYRSIYSDQLTGALQRQYDEMVLRLKCKAARQSANVSGGNSGSQIETGTSAGTLSDLTASDIITAMFEAAEKLDKNDVPQDSRHIVLDPAQFYLLTQGTNAQNRDWGGQGSIAAGTIPQIAGIEIHSSNNVPQGSSLSSPSGAKNDYSLDATSTIAPIFHRSAVGTIQRMAVTMEAGWERRFQSNHVVSKQMHGHGILRPEAAMELILKP